MLLPGHVRVVRRSASSAFGLSRWARRCSFLLVIQTCPLRLPLQHRPPCRSSRRQKVPAQWSVWTGDSRIRARGGWLARWGKPINGHQQRHREEQGAGGLLRPHHPPVQMWEEGRRSGGAASSCWLLGNQSSCDLLGRASVWRPSTSVHSYFCHVRGLFPARPQSSNGVKSGANSINGPHTAQISIIDQSR